MRPQRSERLEECATRMRGMLHLNRAHGPISAAVIAQSLGLPSDASGQAVVRDAARHLNMAGVPVVSDERGFWIATTGDEVRAYRDALLARNRAIQVRCDALNSIAAALDSSAAPRQGHLFDVQEATATPRWRDPDEDR